MDRSLRPLLVTKFAPPPFAGVEAHVDTLARALLPHAHPTVVAARLQRQRSHALPYRLLTSPSYAKVASVFMSPGVMGIARDELRHGRANLLHLHAPNPWGDFVALGMRDTPVVITWHSDIVRQKGLLKLYRPVQERALQRAQRIVVFTPRHYESSTQLKLPGLEHKIAVVPIGIDFAAIDATQEDPLFANELRAWTGGRPLVLTVGRHVSYKGYAHLLSAFAAMRSECVLAMVGAGPLTAALCRQAEELGLSRRVRFLGSLDDQRMRTAMKACDIFTLPSITPAEAFGIASAEAMGCGKPTVVCELNNGVTYLNRAGHTSLVVPPGDEAALAEALDTLASDPALRGRMGAAASQWVRREFGMSAMVNGMLAVYRALV